MVLSQATAGCFSQTLQLSGYIREQGTMVNDSVELNIPFYGSQYSAPDRS